MSIWSRSKTLYTPRILFSAIFWSTLNTSTSCYTRRPSGAIQTRVSTRQAIYKRLHQCKHEIASKQTHDCIDVIADVESFNCLHEPPRWETMTVTQRSQVLYILYLYLSWVWVWFVVVTVCHHSTHNGFPNIIINCYISECV